MEEKRCKLEFYRNVSGGKGSGGDIGSKSGQAISLDLQGW